MSERGGSVGKDHKFRVSGTQEVGRRKRDAGNGTQETERRKRNAGNRTQKTGEGAGANEVSDVLSRQAAAELQS